MASFFSEEPTKEEYERRIAAVNEALRAGSPPPTGQAGGTSIPNALTVAALALGMSRSAFNKSITKAWYKHRLAPDWTLYKPEIIPPPPDPQEALLKLAAQQGYAPDHDLVHELPDGLALKGTSLRYGKDGTVEQYWNKSKLAGREPDDPTLTKLDKAVVTKVSTLYDQEGNVTQQWVAEKPEERAKLDAMRAAVEEIIDPARGKIEPTPAPESTSADILPLIPIGDHHFGMLAWGPENGGDDWDLKIAERLFYSAMGHLIDAAIPSDKIVIATLGDFAHYDSTQAITPTHKNLLDSDTRYAKMLQVCVRALRWTGDRALNRHGSLHWIFEVGNHDLVTTLFLMELFRNLYENEPRVTVDTSPRHFHYFQHGKVALGFHHGHGVKIDELPLIMAHDVPEMWGSTESRYIHTGHRHIDESKEFPGCKVERHNVLGPRDAWADQRGYRAMRSLKLIEYHARYGERARATVSPSMFEV